MTTKALQRSIGSWKLPQPLDVKEDGEWIPLPRIARTIPFGYELDEDDDKVLLPIETELRSKETLKEVFLQRSIQLVKHKNGSLHITRRINETGKK